MRKDLPGSKNDHVIASDVDRKWLKGDEYKNILLTPVKKLFPENRSTIMSVKSTDKASTAFKTLIDHRILSVPVYDVKKRKYNGFLDMIDLLTHCLNIISDKDFNTNTEFNKLFELKDEFRNVTCGEISDASKRNPWKPVDIRMPLATAIEMMVKWHVYRVPVIDSDGELLTVLTQSHVISFISENIEAFNGLGDKSIEELKLGAGGVISVKLSDKAVEAFKKMQTHKISGVGVVNDANELVGNISASDLKEIGHNGSMIGLLFKTVEEFLKVKNPNNSFGPVPVAVAPENTFEEAVLKMVLSKIHRVYVQKVNTKVPVGIVSQSDILKVTKDLFNEQT